jgi:hypothetical protein
MPEYLLPFEENMIFIARTRQIQKRPFSLAVGAVIIPGVRNKAWKIKKTSGIWLLIVGFLNFDYFAKTRETNG